MRAVLAVSLLMGAFAVACAKPESPRVTPKAARVTAVGPAGLDLQVDFDVHNPNAFPLVVNAVDGELKLAGGQQLGRATSRPASTIAAKQTTPVQSQLTIPWAGLSALLPFAVSQSPVPYEFAGNAQIGGTKLNVSVPFVLRGQLTREQLLEIGLRGAAR